MKFHYKSLIFIFYVFVSACFLSSSVVSATVLPVSLFNIDSLRVKAENGLAFKKPGGTEHLNDTLKKYLLLKNIAACGPVVEKLMAEIEFKDIGDSIVWDSYYLTGIYQIYKRDFKESIHLLDSCVSYKERHKAVDSHYAKALYNLSVAYSSLGELHMFEYYAARSLDIWKKIYGESNLHLIPSYLSMAIAYTDKNENETAINILNTGLALAESQPGKVPPSTLADLYYSLGVCYNKTADFSEAKIYFDKTYAIVKNSGLDKDDRFINLMNGLALTCNSLGLKDETEDYYEQGTRLAITNNSSLALNMINSYCVFLADNGKAAKGEKLLEKSLSRAKSDKGFDLRSYFEVLKNYAGYLSEYKIDTRKAINLYDLCIQYLKNNSHDLELITSVNSGYAHALEETGELDKALATVQSLLFSERINSETVGKYSNPAIETLKPDRATLKILRLKYDILWDIYNRKVDIKTLAAVASTGELIVSLLDKVRININEDESRFILGDKYRQSYLNLICDFDMLYKKTSDRHYLEKAFEYSEKSKAAGLLASTRELKAVQFNIPSGIADYERELQREISLINAKISEESTSNNPDMTLIGSWKENLLDFSRKRDSLVKVFEKQYPEYYAIKYNTHMASLNNIPDIIGKEGNYINYVVSDSVLYIFVVNKIHQQLLAIHIDSSFFSDIRRFRSLLAMPSPSEDALSNFKEFQNTGYRLFKTLIEPIRSYLISSHVFISPDNILSYLPFETIPESVIEGESIRYNAVKYLMNDFDISYTYSATFMAESEKFKITGRNKLIAFAPDYPEPINIQSALKSRQSESGVLNDLPYARQEAQYVADITGGTLYENNAAKESVYKKEAGKYDIIHLAMHTLVSDKDPMHSTLIFSQKNDSPEDGLLKTYEIYGIPLKAKMVVLSSCNTGTGQLYSGEGILSLARGFIYSGSQSVIMSMWEIEDKSGTEIVKMFYQNLKKGESKSVALKNARIKFLKNADRLRSHPYFWSALVIYGDNMPLYHPHKWGLAISIVLILFLMIGFYFWKRKYS